MTQELRTFLVILLGLLVICLIVAILMRMVRFVITIACLLIVVPIFFTILWGDGDTYVSKFASLFSPQVEQSINDGYQFYREKDQQDPVVDFEQMKEYANGAVSNAKGSITSFFSDKDAESVQQTDPGKSDSG